MLRAQKNGNAPPAVSEADAVERYGKCLKHILHKPIKLGHIHPFELLSCRCCSIFKLGITRAELAAMLAQFSDAKPVKGVKFSDVSAEHWAYEAIAIAAKMGWIEGYPDGTFRPDATITRAEMMTLVNRALERVPSDEDHLLSKRVMLTFPDCKSGDWFYIAVQEATNSHTYERAATEKNGDEQWTALRANRDWTQLEK